MRGPTIGNIIVRSIRTKEVFLILKVDSEKKEFTVMIVNHTYKEFIGRKYTFLLGTLQYYSFLESVELNEI